jgi:hypothetical protein
MSRALELRRLIENFIANYPRIRDELQRLSSTLNVDNFFQRVNQMDSVKDGADQSTASYFFTIDEFRGNLESFKSEVCHYANKRYVGLFETMITNGTMKLIPYSRIKGDKHNKEVICNNSIYDCGISPETLAKKVDGTNPNQVTTYGNTFDTGPSSSNKATYPDEFSRGKYTIDEEILALLGYLDSRIDFDNKYKCTYLKLYGNTYPNPETTLTKFKQGNAKKKILLTKSPTTADKASLLYVKSLGDKLIAWFYYLYCQANPSSCIFTCDMFVALYALIFDKNFVFNVNDQKEPKVTRVYYKGADINWENLFNNKYYEIKEEYETNINHLLTIKRSQAQISFTGIGQQECINDFIDVLIQKLTYLLNAIIDLNGITSSNDKRTNYSLLLSYKLFNFLIVSKSKQKNNYEFIRSRFKLCIRDTPFQKGKSNTKCNMYELYQSFSQTRGGGRKTWSLFRNFVIDDETIPPAVQENPLYIYDISKLKGSDSDIKESLYTTVTKVYTGLYNSLSEDQQKVCDRFFMSNTMYSWRILRNEIFEDNYSYNDIYDTLTYYFYADPKYDLYSIFNFICDLFVELDIQGVVDRDTLFNGLFHESSRCTTESEATDNIDCFDMVNEWNPFSTPPSQPSQSSQPQYSQVSNTSSSEVWNVLSSSNTSRNLINDTDYTGDTDPLLKKNKGGKKRTRTYKKIKSKRRNTRKNKKY